MTASQKNEEINANFLNWCESTGIDFNGNKLVIKESASKNRHIISNSFVAKGTVLFKIPYECLINPLNSPILRKAKISNKDSESVGLKATETVAEEKVEDEVGEEVEDEVEEGSDSSSTDDWKNLVVVIFQELAKGNSSKWYPYVSILPLDESRKFDNLYYWTQEELIMLAPSKCVERMGLDKIHQMYNEIQEDFDISDMSFNRFLQISSVIMSYSFDVSVKSMVPVADLLNASVNNNAVLQVDDENETYISMVAVKDIKVGEEVYNIYGDHPNGELLRMYGYVEEGNFNEFAEIELRKLVEVDAKYQAIIDKIDDIYDLDDPLLMESYDVYLQGGIISELILVCEILTTYSSEASEQALKSLIKKAFKRVIHKNQMSLETKKLVTLLVENKIKEYKDNEINIESTEKGYSKKYMAAVVVKSELECLEKCLETLEKEYEFIDDNEEKLKKLKKMKDERQAKKRTRMEKKQDSNNKKKIRF